MSRIGLLVLDLGVVAAALAPVVATREGPEAAVHAAFWAAGMTLAWSVESPGDEPVVRALIRRLAVALTASAGGTWVAGWTAAGSGMTEYRLAVAAGTVSALAAGLAGVLGGLAAGGPVAAVTGGIAGGLAVGLVMPPVMALTAGTGLSFDEFMMPALVGGTPAALLAGLAAGLAPGRTRLLRQGVVRAALAGAGGVVLGQALLAPAAVWPSAVDAFAVILFVGFGVVALPGAALGGALGLAIGHAVRPWIPWRRGQ